MPKFKVEVVQTRIFTAELVIEAPTREAARSAVMAGLLREQIEFMEYGVQDSEIHVLPAGNDDEPVAKVKPDGTVAMLVEKKA